MSSLAVAAVLAAATGALLWRPGVVSAGAPDRDLADLARGLEPADGPAGIRRYRLALAVSASLAGVSFLGGVRQWVVAGVLFAVVWAAATRAEPPGPRRTREQVVRDLPHVVRLLGISLTSGASVADALDHVAAALPGPASATLTVARARLSLGAPRDQVWAELARQPGFEPLGRALARADSSGAAVADVVARLGDELAQDARLTVEDRARTVGIRAALPLGVCLLPAFLLIGIVPVVVASVDALQW